MRIDLHIPLGLQILPPTTNEHDAGDNFVRVKCDHCGDEYITRTKGNMWLYENHLVFYGFCNKCKRYTGGIIGDLVEVVNERH